MTKEIDHLMADAVEHGLMNEAMLSTEKNSHPWPVLVMTGFMTLLASIPICGVLFILFFERGSDVTSFFPGVVVMACAIGLLRIPKLALFAHYLGASLLGSGIVLVIARGFDADSIAVGGILALLSTPLVPQPWLRIVLATVSTYLMIYASTAIESAYYEYDMAEWRGCIVAVLGWLFSHIGLQKFEQAGDFSHAAWLESLLIGVGAAVIGMLAYISGSAFLAGGLLHGMDIGEMGWGAIHPMHSMTSVSFTLVAAGWLLAWKGMGEKRWLLAVTPVVAALSWLATSLGALTLTIVVCLVWHRPKLATLAGIAALWTISALYYALHSSLLHKSGLLLVAGVALLASTRLIKEVRAESGLALIKGAHIQRTGTRWALLTPALLILTVINAGIWQNEQVLKQGATVFVELAPVDPRSLMQGDYMTLAFALPPFDDNHSSPPGFVVAQVDDHHIATLARYQDGQEGLAPDEMLIALSQQGTRGVLVTDAFFFKEGEGDRWANARYGEFRVDRNGKAVLIGLRGPGLKEL